MEPKLIIALVTLGLLVFSGIIGSIIYCAFIIGARSEPKEDYYLIIHKEKHPRRNKNE